MKSLLDLITRGVVTAKNGLRKMRTLQALMLDRDLRNLVGYSKLCDALLEQGSINKTEKSLTFFSHVKLFVIKQ